MTIVFGGDFQQILPVIRKGRREQIVGACLQRSRLWCKIEVLHLTENKRLSSGTVEDRLYADWLLKVGNGSANSADNDIQLDPTMKCGDSIDSLLSAIYPGPNTLDPRADNDEWFSNCTILCPRNNSVDELNLKCLNVLKGDIHTFYSADKAVPDESEVGDFQYPVEYLNSINGSGLPLSTLKVKIGAPIMILCNLDPAAGVCNGS